MDDVEDLFDATWAYLTIGVVFIMTLFNQLPFWIGLYVPMIMPYYQHMPMAAFGLFISIINYYRTWKEINRWLIGLFTLANLIGMATIILYFVEYGGIGTAYTLYKGSYNMSFIAGSSRNMSVSVASTATDAQLGSTWYVIWLISSAVLILGLFMQLVFVFMEYTAYEKATGTSKKIVPGEAEEIKKDEQKSNLKRWREHVKGTPWVFQQLFMVIMGSICILFIVFDTVLTFFIPLNCGFIPNQNQNARNLTIFLMMACMSLPMPDPLLPKNHEDLTIRAESGKKEIVFDKRRGETDKEYDKRTKNKHYHADIAVYYNATVLEKSGDRKLLSSGFNQYVILYFGLDIDYFVNITLIITVGFIINAAYLIINVAQQSTWLVQYSNIGSIFIRNDTALPIGETLSITFNTSSGYVLYSNYSDIYDDSYPVDLSADWLVYDTWLNIFSILGSLAGFVFVFIYFWHGYSGGSYKKIMEYVIDYYSSDRENDWKGPSDLRQFMLRCYAEMENEANVKRREDLIAAFDAKVKMSDKKLAGKTKVTWTAPL